MVSEKQASKLKVVSHLKMKPSASLFMKYKLKVNDETVKLVHWVRMLSSFVHFLGNMWAEQDKAEQDY